MVDSIEFTIMEKKVFDSLRVGNAVLQDIQREIGGVEAVEDLMEETREALQNQQDIEDALAGKLTEEDDEALEMELEALERETGVFLPDVPKVDPAITKVPTPATAKTAASSSSKTKAPATTKTKIPVAVAEAEPPRKKKAPAKQEEEDDDDEEIAVHSDDDDEEIVVRGDDDEDIVVHSDDDDEIVVRSDDDEEIVVRSDDDEPIEEEDIIVEEKVKTKKPRRVAVAE
eukprot:TRINITY_DN6461_c0_g1_i3.p2 TRINITY_DN6461_c0_g1~~TRINITY_DN6461_c0_g1_i3.p2  ORF type:complete len:229 (-),score=109.11 TRINITY_DN6461_c0_g1_i3:48-734(-)